MAEAQQTVSDPAPHERRLSLRTADGVTLGAYLYEPRGEVRANLLLSGAVAVPQRFYTAFARAGAGRGLRVLTYDYRGVGASRPERLRGCDYGLSDWALSDYPAALDWLLDHHGARPTVVLGHSFGGQVVGTPPRARRLSGAVLIASQSGYWGRYTGPTRWGMGLLWHGLMPVVCGGFGYVPGWLGLGEDLPAGVGRQWGRWCRDPEYFLGHHPELRAPMAGFDRPLLAFNFEDDALRAEGNERWLLARYTAARAEVRTWTRRELGRPVGHFGFFSRRSESDLWPGVWKFLDRVLADAKEVAA